MLRQSLATFTGKFFIAVVNFLTLILTARYLGAEGRGVISLFIINLTIVSMVSNFIGGPGLVYLFPRHNVTRLLSASYLWAFASSVIVSYVMNIFSLIQPEYFIHLIILSFLQSISRIQSSFLLSKQKIKEYNFISIVYPAVLLLVLFYAYDIRGSHDVGQFFNAMYGALGLSFLYGTWLLYKNAAFSFSINIADEFQQAFKFGFVIQCANIIQLLNYRLSFFLLDHYEGKHDVGVFSTATSFAETVLIIANSFAAIQYSQISNSKNDEENKKLTLLMIKIVSVFTIAGLIFILLLPRTFFSWLLGNDFDKIVSLLPILAPGMMFLIFSIHISHYYSGSGNPKIGLMGSLIGLVATVISGFILIPKYSLTGASVTSTISYISSALLLIFIFMKQKNVSFKDLMPSVKSLVAAKDQFKKII